MTILTSILTVIGGLVAALLLIAGICWGLDKIFGGND